MKKRWILFLTITLCSIFLASCGGREEAEESVWSGVMPGMEDLKELTERTEYYDITTETVKFTNSQLFMNHSGGGFCSFLDTVLYGEEAVQIWEGSGADNTVDIWLYRADGSWELLLSGISREDISQYSRSWYLDAEGNGYCWNNPIQRTREDGGMETVKNVVLTKFSTSGEVQFTRKLDSEYMLLSMCQLGNGRLYLNMTSPEGVHVLAEIDPATGKDLEEGRLEVDEAHLSSVGGGPETLLLKNSNSDSVGDAIFTISSRDGKTDCVLTFTGTSYSNIYPDMSLKDFRMLPDGSFLMLYVNYNGLPQAALDKLTVSKVEKTPVVLRGQFNGDTWISAQAAQFNRQSEEYHVVVEDCGSGNDQEDFARLTSVQIAAGKGPDIISGRLMEDYIPGFLEKGALEELSPYLERDGIREEDYIPSTFGIWREGERIYGLTPRFMGAFGYMMDASLLGTEEEPDVRQLVETLLSLEGTDAAFRSDTSSEWLLDFFLGGSETLWGMVDWEEGTCDFSGELFAHILEAAARYGDSGQKRNAVSLAKERFLGYRRDLFAFQGSKEMEKEGLTVCGSLFDDGCHLRLFASGTMAINSNSVNKEGAWEFLRFLLSEEVQLYQKDYFPVRKDCLDTWLENQLEEVRDGKVVTRNVWEQDESGQDVMVLYDHTEKDITEEKAAEFRQELEEARVFPMRPQKILEFIQEEAADYFNGSKSAAEVSEVIAKRVQLYLNESR